MSEIKVGDLVMVVKPSNCCSNYRQSFYGRHFVVSNILVNVKCECTICGCNYIASLAESERGRAIEIERLKKIDPPSEGDSLPTRKELEVKV